METDRVAGAPPPSPLQILGRCKEKKEEKDEGGGKRECRPAT